MFRRFDPRTRAALWVSLGALAIHLVPLFLPRKVPAVELELAQLVPEPRHRIRLLAPLRDNPQSSGQHLREAATLVLPASIREARDFLLEARRRDPRAVENALLEARICWVEGDERCTELALDQARHEAPSDPRPELFHADFREARGDSAGSLLALERGLEKAPGDVTLRLRYARALGAAGRESAAEDALEPLASALPRHRWLAEQALLRLETGRNAEARSLLEEAVDAEEADASTHYYLGVALFRLEEWTRAEAELRRADQLDPSDFRALALLCALQREEGRVDDAGVSRVMLERRFSSRRAEFEQACPP
jgi:tetratricopeptide (TPR) repeat protein